MLLPISNYSLHWRAKLMAFFSGAYEPIEFIKDFYYYYHFPHYNGISTGILLFSLLSSFLHSLWYILYSSRNVGSSFYSTTMGIVFGKTLKKKRENVERKLMKSALQVLNHYFVFYLEGFYLGNEWKTF
jgi:hypothetical protein